MQNSWSEGFAPAGGVWGSDNGLRALAMRYSRDIVVVGLDLLLLYSHGNIFTGSDKPSSSGGTPWLQFCDGGTQYVIGKGKKAK